MYAVRREPQRDPGGAAATIIALKTTTRRTRQEDVLEAFDRAIDNID